MASLTPLREAANLSLDDVELKLPTGATVAKRWTLVVKGRDASTAARRAAMLVGALREGSGWRQPGSDFPSYISPDKNPRIVKMEVAGNKFLAAMKARQPQVGWRLLREEGILSAGCQKVVRIVPDSSTQVRLEHNKQALADKQLQRSELQAAWDAVVGTVSVQWSS